MAPIFTQNYISTILKKAPTGLASNNFGLTINQRRLYCVITSYYRSLFIKAPLHERQGSCYHEIEMLLSCSDSLHSPAVTSSCHRDINQSTLPQTARVTGSLGLFKPHSLKTIADLVCQRVSTF